MPDPLILRPYQQTDVEALRAAYGQGARAVLYQLETGGGKTVVFATTVGGDYGMLIKSYGEAPTPPGRYSPGICIGAEKKGVEGRPDPAHISTSYVERQNLTMRMHMRRFTRLTNAFTKKAENHAHAVALHFMAYNFVRIHKTLRCTTAMAAGVSKTLWEIADIVKVIEDWEARAGS